MPTYPCDQKRMQRLSKLKWHVVNFLSSVGQKRWWWSKLCENDEREWEKEWYFEEMEIKGKVTVLVDAHLDGSTEEMMVVMQNEDTFLCDNSLSFRFT